MKTYFCIPKDWIIEFDFKQESLNRISNFHGKMEFKFPLNYSFYNNIVVTKEVIDNHEKRVSRSEQYRMFKEFLDQGGELGKDSLVDIVLNNDGIGL